MKSKASLAHEQYLSIPLCHGTPCSMFISQDVEDLLFQLIGSHMISVLGSTDQVIAHLLFLSPICRILSTVGLREAEQRRAWSERVSIGLQETFCLRHYENMPLFLFVIYKFQF